MRYFYVLAGLIVTGGCNEATIRNDLEPYADPDVIRRTQVSEIIGSRETLEGRMIEISGTVTRLGSAGLRWWSFRLGDADKDVICYEVGWHYAQRGLLHQLLRHAASESRPIRVAGRLNPGLRLELDWVEFDGIKYDTDKPGSLVNGPLRF